MQIKFTFQNAGKKPQKQKLKHTQQHRTGAHIAHGLDFVIYNPTYSSSNWNSTVACRLSPHSASGDSRGALGVWDGP